MMLATYRAGYEAPRLPRLRIKICGIREPEHALVAARSGADMVGVVFAKSKRQVSVDEARAVRQALDSLPPDRRPLLAGVFVNETPGRVLEVARLAGLDAVQMSGDESHGDILAVARFLPVLKALRFPAGFPVEKALATLSGFSALGLGGRLRLLVDAYHEKEYGGTGQMADWSLASCLAAHQGIVLAGGLTPGNVADAVREVRPWGVDVSSGVESDGAKDPGLIAQFVEAASRRAAAVR